MPPETPFTPADVEGVALMFVDALLTKEVVPLSSFMRGGGFTGAGVYAIYYTGHHPPYAKIGERNRDGRFAQPIYVGKAVPPGARKGGQPTASKPGARTQIPPKPLYARLSEHRRSIEEASNLDIADFSCRYRLVADDWITVGERLLIQHFQPLWNSVVDGFGLHDPGGKRYTGELSMWDTIHPGRGWATKMYTPNSRPPQNIRDAIDAALIGDTSVTLDTKAQREEANTDER